VIARKVPVKSEQKNPDFYRVSAGRFLSAILSIRKIAKKGQKILKFENADWINRLYGHALMRMSTLSWQTTFCLKMLEIFVIFLT
jgi:hypothetical protein